MKPQKESDTASLTVIGVDIGKEVFHLVGFGFDTKIAFRKRIKRLGLKDAFEKLRPCILGMDAYLSAHFVSRTLRALTIRTSGTAASLVLSRMSPVPEGVQEPTDVH